MLSRIAGQCRARSDAFDLHELIVMPGPDTQPNDAPPGDTAGAYGFRRREIIALIAVAVVVIAFSIVQWWRRDQALAGRQWTVSDIYVDSLLLSRADTITPPSVTGKNFVRLAIAKSPQLPTDTPSHAPKKAWAQSSISAIRCALQNARAPDMGCGIPK